MDEEDIEKATENMPPGVAEHTRKELGVAKELANKMKNADYSSMSPSKTVDFFVDIVKKRFEIDPSGRANPIGDGDFTSDAQWDELIRLVKDLAKDNPNMEGVEKKIWKQYGTWTKTRTRRERLQREFHEAKIRAPYGVGGSPI
jgi:hypothetical protein